MKKLSMIVVVALLAIAAILQGLPAGYASGESIRIDVAVETYPFDVGVHEGNSLESALKFELDSNVQGAVLKLSSGNELYINNSITIHIAQQDDWVPNAIPPKSEQSLTVVLLDPVTLTYGGYSYYQYGLDVSELLTSSNIATIGDPNAVTLILSSSDAGMVFIARQDCEGECEFLAPYLEVVYGPAVPANQAPTEISLDSATVNQSAGENAVVGTLTTTDADAGDTHTYALVSGAGDDDNASFNIFNNQLRANDASQMVAGTYSVRVRSTDSGNLSIAKAFTITVVDDVPPDAPVITTPANGEVTANPRPTISGTAEAGSTVEILIGGNEEGTATADGAGNWTYTPDADWNEGEHEITATATDAADNPSLPSAAVSVKVDTTPPTYTGTPTLSNETKTGVTLTVRLNEPGTVYYVVVAEGEADPSVAQVKAGHNGGGNSALQSGSITVSEADTDEIAVITGLPLSTSYDLYVVAEDSVQNIQATATKLEFSTLDNQDPTDISLNHATVNQSEGVNAVVGTLTTTDADAGDTHTYTLIAGDGDEDNASFTIVDNQLRANDASQMDAGPYSVRIRTTDNDGGMHEKAFTITVADDVAPDAPVITAPTDGTVTKNPRPTFSGTAEADSTVRILVNGSQEGTATADGAGLWEYTPPANWLDSTYVITGTATDAADNTSPPSTAVSVTVDTTAPDAPVVTAPADGSVTANPRPTISGTAEAGSTVEILVDENEAGTATADGSGNWTYTPDADWADGEYEITATATDAANNTSEASTPVKVMVDTMPPTFTNGTPTLSNETKTGVTLTVRLNEPGTVYYVVVADGAAAPGAAQVKAGHNAGDNTALQSGSIIVSEADTDETAVITGLTLSTSYDLHVVAEDSVQNIQAAAAKLDFTTLDNQDPTDISLDHATVNQSEGVNAVVGTLTTTDADAGDTHTYTLVAGDGDEDNASFTILGNQLRANDASQMDAGPYSVRIRTTDNDGGTYEKAFTITVADDVAPDAPVITAPVDGTVTNNPQPTISGTAEAGSTVTIMVNGSQENTVTADGTGNWTYTPDVDWDDGEYEITATATDAADNTSSLSAAINVTVDTTAPDAPVVTAPADGAVTANPRPTISGMAEAGSTVRILVDGDLEETRTADGSGNWTYTPDADWSDREYEITATATDAANNTSPPSTAVSVTVDTTPPSFTNGTPTLSSETKTGVTLTVRLNEPGTVYFVVVADGAAAPNVAQVKAGHNANNTQALGHGSITVSEADTDETAIITGLPLSTPYDLYVVAEDVLQNIQVAAAKEDFSTLANQDPTDISLDHATVNQSEGVNAVVGTLTTTDADAGDTHTYTLVAGDGDEDNASFTIVGNQLRANDASQMDAGPYSVRIRTTDDDGGTYEKAFTITVVDDVAPDAPVITAPTDGTVTKNPRPTFSGTAEADSIVRILINGSEAGTATADGAGNWTYTPSLDWEDGEYEITATATDAADNTSEASTAVSVTVDTTAPDAPVITAPADGAVTANPRPTISGTAEAGSTVGILVNGSQESTATANGDGNWTYTPLADWPDAVYVITTTATDAANNTSEASTPVKVTVDTTPPSFTNGKPAHSNETKTGVTLTVRLNEPGTVYYVVVADGAAAPSAAQVKAGYNAGGDSALRSGSITVSEADTDETAVITGLPLSTPYDLYVVAEDVLQNIQAAATKLDFATLDNQDPTDISLDHATVNQSEGVNAVVGDLTTTDADAGDTHTYTLVAGDGDEDNASFTIVGNQLRANDASQMDAGPYSVRIRTTDNDGGTYEKAFTITVADDVAPDAPVITAPVDGTVTSNPRPTISGTAEADSTVTIHVDGNLENTVTADGTGNWTYTPTLDWADGEYEITATATDAADNTSEASIAVTIMVDTTPPTIHLIGEAAIRIVQGEEYTDAGATAEDALQGDVTEHLVVTNLVDTEDIGHYTVTYNVTDHAGHAAEPVVRTVTVIPAPVTATGGVRRVTVSHAIPEAVLILYNRLDVQVGGEGTADDNGAYVFTAVPFGQGYYVTQTVNGIESDPSQAVNVTTPASSPAPPTPPPVNPGTVRQVPVALDGASPAEQVDIVRKTTSEGKKEDAVILDAAKTASVVSKALEQGRSMVSILIDDLPDDPADEVTVSIQVASVQQLSSNGIALEIRTDHATIQLSHETLQALEGLGIDLFFRIVPIRDEDEKQQVTERTVTAEQVQAVARSGQVGVVGTPMTIETNFTSFKTKVVFPLQGIDLPDNPAQLRQLLASLAVFIEHSDGDKQVQRGHIVFDEAGEPAGIEIEISKFSTFTIFSYIDDTVHVPYISGYTDGTFRPERTVTRAELAAMLSRLLADKLGEQSETVIYPDVPPSHWAAGYISDMRQLGLMSGYPDGTFRPDQPVTRAEYARTILSLLAGQTVDPTLLPADIQGHWAYDSIRQVLAAGRMTGYPDGTFRPDDGLTRAEAVRALNQLFDREPLYGVGNPFSDIDASHWAYGDILEASVEHLASMHTHESNP